MLDNQSDTRLIVIGSSGHAKSLIDIIEYDSYWTISGIVSKELSIDSTFQGYKVFGNDTLLESLIKRKFSFAIGIGQILNVKPRKTIFEYLLNAKANIPTIISANAYISKRVNLGIGVSIFNRVVINSNVLVGNNCIINNCALIEHDSIIGNNVHISTGVLINGSVQIGDNTFIGSGCVIANNIKICDNVILGAGSIVIKSIEEPGVYYGNPLQRKKYE